MSWTFLKLFLIANVCTFLYRTLDLFKFIDPQGQHIFIYYCTYMADYNDQVDIIVDNEDIFYVQDCKLF